MFSQGVQHVVEKAHTGPYPDLLGRGILAGMVLFPLIRNGRRKFGVVREQVKGSAVKGETHLDFRFFGDTFDEDFARFQSGTHSCSGDFGLVVQLREI
jgi:hypothetical protein